MNVRTDGNNTGNARSCAVRSRDRDGQARLLDGALYGEDGLFRAFPWPEQMTDRQRRDANCGDHSIGIRVHGEQRRIEPPVSDQDDEEATLPSLAQDRGECAGPPGEQGADDQPQAKRQEDRVGEDFEQGKRIDVGTESQWNRHHVQDGWNRDDGQRCQARCRLAMNAASPPPTLVADLIIYGAGGQATSMANPTATAGVGSSRRMSPTRQQERESEPQPMT